MKNLRKIGSALLAVLILLMATPLSALAEVPGADSRKEVLVYLTVALQGKFQQGRDGTLMAQVPMAVSDTNGDKKVSVQEALEQFHQKYCPNGFSVRGAKCGPEISRLWNRDVTYAGFYINHQRGFALRDELNFYDSLYVFSQNTPADSYVYFAKNEDQAVCLREYPVQLFYQTYDDLGKTVSLPLKDAKVYQVKQDGSLKDLHAKTDEEGKASLVFREPGDFVLTAKSSLKNSVSPVLKVKVARGTLSLVMGQ